MTPDAFRDPYRSPPVPPRTSFVAPWVFFHIARKNHLRIVVNATGHDTVRFTTPVGVWSIVSDPDCPVDYTWPEVTPDAVAEVIREGIADAKAAREAAP